MITTLTRFTPAARRTIVRAGTLAAEAGRDTLDTGYLLLALSESGPLTAPVGDLAELGITTASVRAEIDAWWPPRRDRELLATLGIDLDDVRRRAQESTSARHDDPALWRLRRSRLRPLRVTLTGPAVELRLDEGGRKVVEVAHWAARKGKRSSIHREDLLWGLLADGTNASVRVLRRHGIDLHRLWTDLRTWHRSAA